MNTHFAEYGQMLRAPDLRLGDVRTVLVRGRAPFEHHIGEPTRGLLVFVRKGTLTLTLDHSASPPIAAPAGTAAGFEAGRAHRWSSGALAAGTEIELFVSSIPRRMGVLQGLADGVIVVPADAEPAARILRSAVELHLAEIDTAESGQDDSIVRRCAEICMIQLVRFARARLAAEPSVPAGVAHDENLLRAWSAYFTDPQRRWTLKALAEAAGLGRTAFSERFRSVVGAPPLQTLRTLRLEYAETMLRHSKAPLIEIAFRVGYNSEAAFIRAFNRHYGVPPGRLRAQQGQGALPPHSPPGPPAVQTPQRPAGAEPLALPSLKSKSKAAGIRYGAP